jgi:hypothetical protein
MVMNGDAESAESTHIIFHEYTHFVLSSQFAGEYPPWFNEGLAELMGFAKFDKDKAVMQIPMYRVYEARDGKWIPFDRLIRVDHNSPEYQSHKLADSFYAQAWLTDDSVPQGHHPLQQQSGHEEMGDRNAGADRGIRRRASAGG